MLHTDAAIVLLPLMDELSHTCHECKQSQTTEEVTHRVYNGMSGHD